MSTDKVDNTVTGEVDKVDNVSRETRADLDKVISSAPINRTAAMVTSKNRVPLYKPKLNGTEVFTDIKPPIQNVVVENDLTGLRVGRLVVIGVYANPNPSKNTRRLWVCRCDCGMFVTRKTKVVSNPANFIDRCLDCRNLLHLKRQDRRNSTGKWVDPSEISE